MALPPDTLERHELLLKMSERIGRTFDLPEILKLLLDAVRQVVPFDAAGVFVLSEFVSLPGRRTNRVIAAMAMIGFNPDPNREDPMLGAGKGIIGQVIRTGVPIVAPDVRLNPHYIAGRESTLSEVAIPIAIGARVIGALNLESDRIGAYTDADARDLGFFATAAAISIERAVLHHQVLEKQHLDHHMVLAREVQESLLPRSAPWVPGYDLDGINLPTMEIGGDYYDYLPLADGGMALVVADVSGKGVAAALIMATFRAALRIELRREHAVARVMDEVDRLLLDSIDPSRYVTAVYGILEPETGEFTYVNCGHNPPMVLHARGGCTLLDKGRPALGMPMAGTQETGRVQLEAGDMLAIYTDGVVEVSAVDGVEFGPARLESLLRRHSGLPAKEVVQTVVRDTLDYTGRSSYEDDFTLLIVKRET
jgi:sigma-B regulation protein RsbU (phosphoserine phosphatase)